MGFFDKIIALRLSQYTKGLSVVLILNSRSNEFSHNISMITDAKLRYSASVEDLATTDCFLELHEIKLLPRKTQ